MPTFVAKVRDSQGKSKQEKVVADSMADARTEIRQQGYEIQD